MLSTGSGSHPSSSLLAHPSQSPHKSVMLKTLHWSQHPSQCPAMPTHHGMHYSHLQHWCLSPSPLLWQTYIHNCTDIYNSQLLIAWLVTKILLWNVVLAKHILSFTSFTDSIKHTTSVLGVSHNTAWNILWYSHQDTVACLCSWWMIHNLYIAQKWHILQKSNTSIHKEQNVSTLHIHGSVQYLQNSMKMVMAIHSFIW